MHRIIFDRIDFDVKIICKTVGKERGSETERASAKRHCTDGMQKNITNSLTIVKMLKIVCQENRCLTVCFIKSRFFSYHSIFFLSFFNESFPRMIKCPNSSMNLHFVIDAILIVLIYSHAN